MHRNKDTERYIYITGSGMACIANMIGISNMANISNIADIPCMVGTQGLYSWLLYIFARCLNVVCLFSKFMRNLKFNCSFDVSIGRTHYKSLD